MNDPRARLATLLRPVLEASGVDLEDLQVTPAGRRRVVRVVVDKDGGISLDDVADASRVLSEALDDVDAREPALLAGAYVLEVSSPGVDRPLTAARHWRRNAGRLVTAVLADGGTVTGRVVGVEDDERVVLDVAGAEQALPLAEVVRGTVQVEFDRRDGGGDPAAEDDVLDADETDETDETDDETAAVRP